MKDAYVMGIDGKLVKHEIEETADGELVEKMSGGKKIAVAILLAAMAGSGIFAYLKHQPAEPRKQQGTEYRENQSYHTGQEYSAKK